ncbi:MAG: GxxExxY protein [Planctomycetaceae bacterium]|nr:GxxExxY protein [Planctomycetaceae bacterium]
MSKLIYDEESYQIRGACMEVYKEMGIGYLEAVYQECLEREFSARGIPFQSQQELVLHYKGSPLRQTYKPDFICYDKIVVEIKGVPEIHQAHKAQIINYLKATGFKLGLLVNFGAHPLIQIERFAN